MGIGHHTHRSIWLRAERDALSFARPLYCSWGLARRAHERIGKRRRRRGRNGEHWTGL